MFRISRLRPAQARQPAALVIRAAPTTMTANGRSSGGTSPLAWMVFSPAVGASSGATAITTRPSWLKRRSRSYGVVTVSVRDRGRERGTPTSRRTTTMPSTRTTTTPMMHRPGFRRWAWRLGCERRVRPGETRVRMAEWRVSGGSHRRRSRVCGSWGAQSADEVAQQRYSLRHDGRTIGKVPRESWR